MSLDQVPPPADRSPGYKPDPLGSKNTRRWDGQTWTTDVLPPKGSGMSAGKKWLIGIGAGLVVLIAIGSAIGEEETDPPVEQSAPVEQVQGFDRELQDAVLESVEEKGTPIFWCNGPECRVQYRRGEALGFLASAQEELLSEQRRIWQTMFSRPQTKSARIFVNGPVTTVGGKSKVSRVLEVECSRAAANQINWDAVDVDGMRQLCDWNELVDFG